MISFREYLKENIKEYFIVYLPGLKARILENKNNARYDLRKYVFHETDGLKSTAEHLKTINPKISNKIFDIVDSVKNILDQEPTINFKIPSKLEAERASEETIDSWEKEIKKEIDDYPKELFQKIIFEINKLDEIIKYLDEKNTKRIKIRKNNIENYKDFI